MDRPIRMLVAGAGRGLQHLRSFQNLQNSFAVAGLVDLNEKIDLPVIWNSKKFVPYNYGYFAFVYNLSLIHI